MQLQMTINKKEDTSSVNMLQLVIRAYDPSRVSISHGVSIWGINPPPQIPKSIPGPERRQIRQQTLFSDKEN